MSLYKFPLMGYNHYRNEKLYGGSDVRKIIAVMAALIAMLALSAAIAEVKMTVVESAQFVYDTGKDNKYHVYMYGIVRNDGDETVNVKSSTLNIVDAAGEIVGEEVKYVYVYPEYLTPGETGCYYRDVTLSDVTNPEALYSHSVNLVTDTRSKNKRYLDAKIVPVIEAKSEYYYISMNTTLLNMYPEMAMDPVEVITIRDQDGKLLFANRHIISYTGLYTACPVMIVQYGIPTDLTKVWVKQGCVPTEFDIISYEVMK